MNEYDDNPGCLASLVGGAVALAGLCLAFAWNAAWIIALIALPFWLLSLIF